MTTRRSILRYSRDAERLVAKLLGGERVPSTGLPGKADVVGGGFFVAEVKHGPLPDWMLGGMEQAEQAARIRANDPVPLLALVHKPGRGRRRRVFIVMDYAWWVDLHGKPSEQWRR